MTDTTIQIRDHLAGGARFEVHFENGQLWIDLTDLDGSFAKRLEITHAPGSDVTLRQRDLATLTSDDPSVEITILIDTGDDTDQPTMSVREFAPLLNAPRRPTAYHRRMADQSIIRIAPGDHPDQFVLHGSDRAQIVAHAEDRLRLGRWDT